MKKYSPHEITPVFQALSVTRAVIIGGQAINLWAERFAQDSSFWKELRPYTSFDLDVLGSRTDVLRCSQALKAEPFFPSPTDNTANSGKIVTQIEGLPFEIDFLHSPNGLAPAEVAEFARTVTFAGIPLKVLHPLHCVESKTVNLATISQDGGSRQDLKHLRLSIAILREYLIKQTKDGVSEQILLRWAHRIRMNSIHELGIQAAIKHGINFQDAIPADVWLTHAGPLADFATKEWQAWRNEITEKTSDIRELEIWLKSLNAKPKPKGLGNR